MPEVMQLERRGHYRGKSRPGRRVAVEYRTLEKGEEGPALRAFTHNIGIGGAFIVTADPAPPGTSLKLELKVPSAQKAILVKAEVRWIADDDQDEPQGMGVRFSGLEAEEVLLLNEYFASLTRVVELDGQG
jgi:uncharacterized protein (TIGR02266 family)